MKLGDTFYFNHAAAHGHLWVVVGGPNADDEFVIFNMTSARDGCDTSCVLGVGDHPMIEHPTYITYLRGRQLPASLAQSAAHQFAWQQPVAPEILARIQHGALASQFTSKKLREIVQASLDVQVARPTT